jgi:hypothetical protein
MIPRTPQHGSATCIQLPQDLSGILRPACYRHKMNTSSALYDNISDICDTMLPTAISKVWCLFSPINDHSLGLPRLRRLRHRSHSRRACTGWSESAELLNLYDCVIACRFCKHVLRRRWHHHVRRPQHERRSYLRRVRHHIRQLPGCGCRCGCGHVRDHDPLCVVRLCEETFHS